MKLKKHSPARSAHDVHECHEPSEEGRNAPDLQCRGDPATNTAFPSSTRVALPMHSSQTPAKFTSNTISCWW